MKPKDKTSSTQVVSELEDMRQQSEDYLEEAQAIETAAVDEGGRELTEDEYTQIEDLVNKSDELNVAYTARLKEDKRSAIRASIEMGRQTLIEAPDAGSVFAGRPQVTSIRTRFYEDPKRGFSGGLGEFAGAVAMAAMPNAGLMDERLTKIVRESADATGMSQQVGSDGGILVPPEFRNEIWFGIQQTVDNLMSMTDQFTVTGESLTMPAVAETSRANGSRYGGVRAFWISEAAQMTASLPKLRQLKLEPQQVAALIYVTDKLLKNAPALNTFMTRAAGEEIMFVINDAIINGDGVGKPKGILEGGGLITVAKETGQAAGTIVLENIHNMYTRLNARARKGAVWLTNQDTEPQLEALSSVVGTGGHSVYLPQGAGGPTIVPEPNARLKGLPVMPVEYCQTLGTAGDIILVNLGFYAMGIQGGLMSDMSMHLRFDYNETAFRFLFAIDGQPWLNNKITPFKGTSTTSAYVNLATRA